MLLFGLGTLCLVTDSVIVLKLYPLLMNLLFLGAFGSTLFFPPVMIFRFAVIQDKSIKGSLAEKRITAYCRKVTFVWMVFFCVNGSMAAWSIFSGSDTFWSVYNGGISYILMGILFAGEFLVRKKVQKKMPGFIPLSSFKNNSRSSSAILCYQGEWSAACYKTWKDFLEGTAALRGHIEKTGGEKWLLHCEDCWYFLLAFTALLQCKKEILLTANISPAYIAEIRDDAPFLTDRVFTQDESSGAVFHIPALLEEIPLAGLPAEGPGIKADETSIVMYTSGSTGRPKAVRQRLTEFETDNRFVISKWGEEFLRRKVCSTVSQHHIYGLLFSILLPFSAGVPFKRERIEFPGELEKLSDTEYMIITVPAFLKRAVEIEKTRNLRLKSPWIFTSGGVLEKETAEKTSEVFGFWPVEVYGSTETSGIAYRQSVNGPEWTAFDNAELSKNSDGCLIIRSPYIKDPAGFETADLVEILRDGRFLLKGRIDSVVKIEEKRVSLPEIENRITQSGLAADVWVTALEDKRQYLAAVIAFNSKGKERFSGLEKYEINKFWREYLLQFFENIVIPKRWRYPETLPLDAQGKKKKDELKLLFADEKKAHEGETSIRLAELNTPPDPLVRAFGTTPAAGVLIEKTENSVTVDFSIPPESPYFDGHFPGFPILSAVAQVDLMLRFARQYLDSGIEILEIPRVKFSKLIRPHTPLRLRLEKNEKKLSFKIRSGDGETIYSSGMLVIREDR